MTSVFHGSDEATHESFQEWRREHPDGFNLSEGKKGCFAAHWTEDRRDNGRGRGCMHQGGSGIRYKEDGMTCLTVAKKVCSDSLHELLEWANRELVKVRPDQQDDSAARTARRGNGSV